MGDMQELQTERTERVIRTLERVSHGMSDTEDAAFLAAELGVHWTLGLKSTKNTNTLLQEIQA